MLIEMRTYKIKPGKRAEFIEIFRTRSVPAHAEIGMKILGPFLSVEDPDTFFFMRGFPDLASRDPMKARFYEGPLWKRELEHVLIPMIEKYDVVLVDDPEGQGPVVSALLRGHPRRRLCLEGFDEVVEVYVNPSTKKRPQDGWQRRHEFAGDRDLAVL